MSTVPDVEPAAPPNAPRDPGRGSRLGRRPVLLAAGSALAVCALGVGVMVATSHGTRSSTGKPVPPSGGSATSPAALSKEAKARAKAAPMPTTTSAEQRNGTTLHVLTAGSIPVNRRTVRVVSGLTDLSSARELTWRADEGKPVGDARCTQLFRIGSPNAAPGLRPTMMLCWRLSQARSAYALVVSLDDPPSAPATVKLVDEAWSKLG